MTIQRGVKASEAFFATLDRTTGIQPLDAGKPTPQQTANIKKPELKPIQDQNHKVKFSISPSTSPIPTSTPSKTVFASTLAKNGVKKEDGISDHIVDLFSKADLSWSDEAPSLRHLIQETNRRKQLSTKPKPSTKTSTLPVAKTTKSTTALSKEFLYNYFETLRLVNQRIDEIDESMSQFAKLKELSFTGNLIEKVDNLPGDLEMLHLNANKLTKCPDLFNFTNLVHIGLGYNKINSLTDVEGDNGSSLWFPPQLASLDISYNDLEDLDATLDVLCQMSNLKILAMIGNPFYLLPRYRKTTLSRLQKLIHFDDQVITNLERSKLEEEEEEITKQDDKEQQINHLSGDEVELDIQIIDVVDVPKPPEIKPPEDPLLLLQQQQAPATNVQPQSAQQQQQAQQQAQAQAQALAQQQPGFEKPLDEFSYRIEVRFPHYHDSDKFITRGTAWQERIEYSSRGKIRKPSNLSTRDTVREGVQVVLVQRRLGHERIPEAQMTDAAQVPQSNAVPGRPPTPTNMKPIDGKFGAFDARSSSAMSMSLNGLPGGPNATANVGAATNTNAAAAAHGKKEKAPPANAAGKGAQAGKKGGANTGAAANAETEPMWRQIVLETNVLGYGIIDMDAFLHGETFVERAITFHAPPPEPHPPVLDKKTLEKLPAVGSTKIKVALNGSKKDKLQTIMALSSEDITQE